MWGNLEVTHKRQREINIGTKGSQVQDETQSILPASANHCVIFLHPTHVEFSPPVVFPQNGSVQLGRPLNNILLTTFQPLASVGHEGYGAEQSTFFSIPWGKTGCGNKNCLHAVTPWDSTWKYSRGEEDKKRLTGWLKTLFFFCLRLDLNIGAKTCRLSPSASFEGETT